MPNAQKQYAVECDGRWDGCRDAERWTGSDVPTVYLDEKGFAYCRECGPKRQEYRRCRKLRPWEARRIGAGRPLARY